MLHYVSLNVTDLERSAAFYDAILAPLGWRRHIEERTTIGWGLNRPAFFVAQGEAQRSGFGQVSFPTKSIPAVKASYASGMENGGEGVDGPGSPPAFGGGNYSARLRDPDGYTVEICVSTG